MSIKQIATMTCDNCGHQHTSQESHFSYRTPEGWAEIDIDWTDTEGERHGDFWHLCPDCTGKLLTAVIANRTAALSGGTA